MNLPDMSPERSPLDPTPTNEGVSDSFPILWGTFVKNVLDGTVQGYHTMYRECRAQPEWEENQFTGNLRDYIRPHAQERSIMVMPLTKDITTEMKAGKKTVKKAKELDLRLFSFWKDRDYLDYSFVWECKLIAVSVVNKCKHLVYEYIIDGMIRFLNEEWKYAHYVDDAGMLGYVLSGDVSDIVKDINQEMLTPPRPRKSSKSKSRPTRTSLSTHTFSEADNLKPAPTVDTFTNVYKSSHTRVFCGRDLSLYHLFFTFNFTSDTLLSVDDAFLPPLHSTNALPPLSSHAASPPHTKVE